MIETLDRYPAIFEIMYIHPEGRILAQQRRVGLSDQKAFEKQPWLETVQAGHVYWGTIDMSTYGVPFLDIAVPVNYHNVHRQGNFAGTLLAKLDLTVLWSSVASERVGETGYAYIINSDGQLLAYRNINQVKENHRIQDMTKAPLDDILAANTDIFKSIRTGVNDRLVVSSASSMATIPWIAIVEQPVEEALQPFSVTLAVMLVLVLIVLGIVVSIAQFTQRRIVDPLVVMRDHVEQFQQGTMTRDIELRRHGAHEQDDEMVVLAGTFNQMARQLRELIDGLEYQVAERTAQLAEAVKEAQEARKAAEGANELKSKFIANMSHELRTPLNSIINFTRIISSGLRGPVTDEQQDYLHRVRASGEHLLGLINDILDLSKIEAGRMELYKQDMLLGELVESTLSTAIGLTKGKPVELHADIDESLPPIEADRTRIRQVLLNLLSNAAKFTDEGSITVHVRREGKMLVVRVTDTGIGIQESKLQTIFEEFRQADEGDARSYEGTGLGLAICKRLIEMHGGEIWVKSTVGVGSTFSFSLPVACDEEPVPSAMDNIIAPQSEFAAGIPVLVIDDDTSAIEIVMSYLSKDGYAVYGTHDGRTVLDVVRHIKPAAIILDILLPHKDGWEVLSELKTAPDLKDTPVILYTILEEQKIGLHLGANAYLVKPIQEDQLRSVVNHFVPRDATILAIDDNPDVLEMVSQYLGSTGGYRVVTANGGRMGLEQVRAVQPDLIVLDLMMPEVDGFAVLNQLDQDPQTREIPVIVLTAKDLTPSERLYLSQRVQSLQYKGETSPGDLLQRVHTLVTHH
ncbi:MAG: response regulator [Chloroflexaceae bacterium]|nr:response regulator [Chloroflexaceae bacterium]